ncbi:hypothetical protein B0H34DRAFT_220794 [Crassisporium funariophilum]|nr:hypothetical protein B0H34DRAFT_220794 [Crassisporium funariophilum]
MMERSRQQVFLPMASNPLHLPSPMENQPSLQSFQSPSLELPPTLPCVRKSSLKVKIYTSPSTSVTMTTNSLQNSPSPDGSRNQSKSLGGVRWSSPLSTIKIISPQNDPTLPFLEDLSLSLSSSSSSSPPLHSPSTSFTETPNTATSSTPAAGDNGGPNHTSQDATIMPKARSTLKTKAFSEGIGQSITVLEINNFSSFWPTETVSTAKLIAFTTLRPRANTSIHHLDAIMVMNLRPFWEYVAPEKNLIHTPTLIPPKFSTMSSEPETQSPISSSSLPTTPSAPSTNAPLYQGHSLMMTQPTSTNMVTSLVVKTPNNPTPESTTSNNPLKRRADVDMERYPIKAVKADQNSFATQTPVHLPTLAESSAFPSLHQLTSALEQDGLFQERTTSPDGYLTYVDKPGRCVGKPLALPQHSKLGTARLRGEDRPTRPLNKVKVVYWVNELRRYSFLRDSGRMSPEHVDELDQLLCTIEKRKADPLLTPMMLAETSLGLEMKKFSHSDYSDTSRAIARHIVKFWRKVCLEA